MAQIAPGLQGQVTKENYGASMPAIAPLYPAFGQGTGWEWDDIDLLMIDYTTDAEAAAAVLPAECTLIDIPSAPGQSPVKFAWARYRGGTLGPYLEAFQTIPCLYEGNLYLYVAGIWVDTDIAMASGREVGGFPKKLAGIGINFLGNSWTGYLDRPASHRIASFTFETTGRMVSIPLPADRTPMFPFPYNLALPLPAPTGQPQALPFTTLSMRLIPSAAVDAGPWAMAQLNGSLWTLEEGTQWAGDATLAFHPSEQDPVANLPVNAILDAMLFRGDMKAIQTLVLQDL